MKQAIDAGTLALHDVKSDKTIPDKGNYPHARSVGLFRYLVDSRLDLAYIARRLTRNLARLTMRHWMYTNNAARYFKITLHHGILYSKGVHELRAQ